MNKKNQHYSIFKKHPNNRAIAKGLEKIPSDWSLTTVREKRPYRKNWQNETPISRAEIRGIIEGNQLISKKTGKPYRAFNSGFGILLGDRSGGIITLDVDGKSANPILLARTGGHIPKTVAWTSNYSEECKIKKAINNHRITSTIELIESYGISSNWNVTVLGLIKGEAV